MAKKSPSAVKNSKGKSKPSKVKASVKSVKKPVVKALKKLVASAVKKVTKAVKASNGVKAKTAKQDTLKKAAKAIEKPVAKKIDKHVEKEETVVSKPALMTKKGKADPVVTEDVSNVASDALADKAPVKAEKVSKAKPIRIEKGNIDDEKAKWAELFKKLGKDKAINYKMSDTFSALSPVQHKVLGWGFILKNDNDRLEVLFETGIRMLISNYKS